MALYSGTGGWEKKMKISIHNGGNRLFLLKHFREQFTRF